MQKRKEKESDIPTQLEKESSPTKKDEQPKSPKKLKADPTTLFAGKGGESTWDDFADDQDQKPAKSAAKETSSVKDQSGTEIKFGSTTTFGIQRTTKPVFSTEASESFGSVKKSTSFGGTTSSTAPKSFAALLEETKKEEQGDLKDLQADSEEPQVQLQETQVSTGEEEENTLFSCRCKLFYMADTWKERGVGMLKLNTKDGKARLVMRSDGVLKLILNIQVIKGMPLEIVQDKFLRIVGSETGDTLSTFLLKMSKKEQAKELVSKMKAYTSPAESN